MLLLDPPSDFPRYCWLCGPSSSSSFCGPYWPLNGLLLRGVSAKTIRQWHILLRRLSQFNCLIGLVYFYQPPCGGWLPGSGGDVHVCLCAYWCDTPGYPPWQEGCLPAAGKPPLVRTSISNCDPAAQPWHGTERPYLKQLSCGSKGWSSPLGQISEMWLSPTHRVAKRSTAQPERRVILWLSVDNKRAVL